MARDWEAWLANSVGPASDTEEQDRDRTERRIREAILAHPRLVGNVKVFVKGSYATGTNVRRDSDVDIAVEWNRWAYIEKKFEAADYSWAQLGVPLTESGPAPDEYRQWVEEALYTAFPSSTIDPGNKAIRVEGGSTTLDADVVPCFRYKRYDKPGVCHVGIQLHPRIGDAVINWPRQNLDNGDAKNRRTGLYFKRMVRAFKRLENDMVDVGRLSSEVPGYLIECLLWNCPDEYFTASTYKERTELLLLWLWNGLHHGEEQEWTEVNALKYLFRGSQKWTRDDALGFVRTAYKYIFG